MDATHKFWRRLSLAGTIMGAALFIAFYFAYRSASQAEGMNRWVDHTQEVLGILGQVRLERLRLQNLFWAYHETRNTELLPRFRSECDALGRNLIRLRTLTSDNPAQQEILDQVILRVAAQTAALQEALEKVASSPEPPPELDWVARSAWLEDLQGQFEKLNANENKLLSSRTAAVQKDGRQTRIVLLLAGILSFGILWASAYLIWSEIRIRAMMESGLRRAQELLGGKYREGQEELGQALEDLHREIGVRQSAEDEIRGLNAELEERVEQRTRELREVNSEIEAFSYSVSHDLRAPLRHIDGFSKILEQEFGPQLPADARHYIDRIRSSTTRMTALVEDLLRLSRIGRQLPQMRTVSLSTLAEEAAAEVLPEAEGRAIDWKIEELPEAEVDPALFRQVLTNLISNAVKFSRNQPHAVIEIGSREEAGETMVFVRDNGAGFDPRYADKLFGVFQRLHRQDEFEGTGIGLATAQRILHKHGCRIWAESQPEQGATFYFTVPTHGPARLSSKERLGATA